MEDEATAVVVKDLWVVFCILIGSRTPDHPDVFSLRLKLLEEIGGRGLSLLTRKSFQVKIPFEISFSHFQQ